MVDRSQLLKGTLDVALLATLGDKPNYGHGLFATLADAGLPGLADASVYGALRRLESEGMLDSELVQSAAGPARKYYRLTPTGRSARREAMAAWEELVEGNGADSGQERSVSPARSGRPAYVEAIAENLRDVPWAQREELLDDVALHLGDTEFARDEIAPWTERFGSPADYARQLRADLGLPTDATGLRRARRFQLRHTRIRVKLLIGLAAIAAGALIVTVVWANRVQPLGFGDITVAPGAKDLKADGGREFRWRWRRGDRFAVGSWLRNDSAVPVRVAALDLERILVPWDNWRVELATSQHELRFRATRRFAAFTLAPGERQLVWFTGDFSHCPKHHMTGSGTGISSIAATFKVLGITRHERVPLGFTYSVTLDRACSTA